MSQAQAHPLATGQPIPWFTAPTAANPNYQFGTVAGRWVVLAFAGSTGHPVVGATMDRVFAHAHRFDGEKIAFFGVTVDPLDDERQPDKLPGIRWFRDADAKLSRSFGAMPPGSTTEYRAAMLLLDPTLRIYATFPVTPDGADQLLALIDQLPAPADHAGVELTAPVLVVPRVLAPDQCRALIDHYRAVGGTPSGFMREIDGRTVGLYDDGTKRRSDCEIQTDELRAVLRDGVVRCLVPEIAKAFQFHTTRIERYIVACYDGSDKGFFRPHRDNTTRGTAHRRFAVTINLNTGEYDGGGLRFPEFGNRVYVAPLGGAVVFSCSLLHEALPVTRGLRYATLPFLYDDAAAKIREQNLAYVDPGKPPAAAEPGAVAKISIGRAAPPA